MMLGLSGCVREPSPNVSVSSEVSLGDGVWRKEDKEHGVVCYMLYTSSIHCLKIPKHE